MGLFWLQKPIPINQNSLYNALYSLSHFYFNFITRLASTSPEKTLPAFQPLDFPLQMVYFVDSLDSLASLTSLDSLASLDSLDSLDSPIL